MRSSIHREDLNFRILKIGMSEREVLSAGICGVMLERDTILVVVSRFGGDE